MLPTVHRHIATNHKSSGVTNNKSDKCSNFARLPKATNRNPINNLLPHIFAHRHHHLGSEIAWRNSIDRHTFSRHLLGESFRKAMHTRFGSRIISLSELALATINGRDINYATPTALHHWLNERFSYVKHRIQIRTQHGIPGSFIHFA